MYTANLRKVGGSIMLAVPRPLLETLDLGIGAEVGLKVEGDRLVIEPRRKRRHTLDELLALCNPDAPVTKEDRQWLDAPAVGREL